MQFCTSWGPQYTNSPIEQLTREWSVVIECKEYSDSLMCVDGQFPCVITCPLCHGTTCFRLPHFFLNHPFAIRMYIFHISVSINIMLYQNIVNINHKKVRIICNSITRTTCMCVKIYTLWCLFLQDVYSYSLYEH